MRSFSSLSARSCTPYCLDTTSAISRMSIESRPRPSPYKGASGSMSAGATSRFRAATMRAATSRTSVAAPAGGGGRRGGGTFSGIETLEGALGVAGGHYKKRPALGGGGGGREGGRNRA